MYNSTEAHSSQGTAVDMGSVNSYDNNDPILPSTGETGIMGKNDNNQK